MNCSVCMSLSSKNFSSRLSPSGRTPNVRRDHELFDRLLFERDPILGKRHTSANAAMLFYMYWNCEIGGNGDAKPTKHRTLTAYHHLSVVLLGRLKTRRLGRLLWPQNTPRKLSRRRRIISARTEFSVPNGLIDYRPKRIRWSI